MDQVIMSYDNDHTASIFKNWYSDRSHLHNANLTYFGDIIGSSIVDFGCGDGEFLNLCLSKGAFHCLGIDLNESMIRNGLDSTEKTDHNQGTLQFAIQDCFQPLKGRYGQFEFASCHFLIQSCSDQDQLKCLYQNMFHLLKRGGELFIICAPIANTLEEQQAFVKCFGMKIPSKSDGRGMDPFLAHVPVYKPFTANGSTDKANPGEEIFSFNEYYWSEEKLMNGLEEAGFIDIQLIKPIHVDNDNGDQELNHVIPFIFIGAEKP